MLAQVWRKISLCLAIAAGIAGPALAQTATTPPAAKPKIEEITVTSQKRSENVRKVPLSVTVLSGAQIRAAHIENFADLTRNVPNLSFSSQAGEGLSNLEMRGISSSAGTATVALYLDDTSLTTRNLPTEGAVEPRFLDIARVEVLRGPQSTLYGASALGGTLRYISNQPVMNEFSGNVFSEISGTYHGGGPNYDEQGVLNIPLVNNQLVLRVAGETGADAGWINLINPSNGAVVKSGINSTGFNVFHGSLVWKPTDWLTLTPSVFFQDFIQHDSDAEYLTIPNNETPKQVAEPGNDRLIVPSFTVNADLGFATLIAATGNYERQFVRTLDSSVYDNLSVYLCNPLDTEVTCTDDNGNPLPNNAPNGLFNALNNRPSETYYSNTVRQWSEEVRLVSKPYEPGESALPITWIAGLYYSDEHTTSTDTEFVNGANALFKQYGVSPADESVIESGFPGDIVNNEVYQGITAYDTSQYAVFGDVTYYPLPNVRITFGARYQYARDGESTYQNYYYDYGDAGLITSVGHFYTFLPNFSIGWDVTPSNTIYANASKGFRLGSENRRIPFVASETGDSGTPSYDFAQLGIRSSPTNFGPDKLWNFEIGDKGRFLGGRVTANADFFYILWSDIQTEIPLVTSGDEFQTNAGNATSYGAEFDVRGKVTEDLTASLSGSVVNARLIHGVEVNGVLITGTFPGEKIPGVPDFNLSANLKQNFQVTDNISGFASISPDWVGESHGDVITTNPDYNRPSYITLDASAGVDFGRWEVTVFGRNLTNNNKIIQRPDIQGSASPEYEFDYLGVPTRNVQGFTLRPLTVGMNASVKF